MKGSYEKQRFKAEKREMWGKEGEDFTGKIEKCPRNQTLRKLSELITNWSSVK